MLIDFYRNVLRSFIHNGKILETTQISIKRRSDKYYVKLIKWSTTHQYKGMNQRFLQVHA